MPTPTHVQVAPAGSGPNIDAQQLTSTESGNPTVDRQTITIGDPSAYGNVAAVTSEGYLQVARRDASQQLAVNKMQLAAQQAQIQSFGGAGFVPLEIPSFLGGY
jgi:hypothetical protein